MLQFCNETKYKYTCINVNLNVKCRCDKGEKEQSCLNILKYFCFIHNNNNNSFEYGKKSVFYDSKRRIDTITDKGN